MSLRGRVLRYGNRRLMFISMSHWRGWSWRIPRSGLVAFGWRQMLVWVAFIDQDIRRYCLAMSWRQKNGGVIDEAAIATQLLVACCLSHDDGLHIGHDKCHGCCFTVTVSLLINMALFCIIMPLLSRRENSLRFNVTLRRLRYAATIHC